MNTTSLTERERELIVIPNLMTTTQYEQVEVWRERFGGKPIRAAADALKALEEMIELCYACGALPAEVDHIVNKETMKALNRGEANGVLKPSLVPDETADVLICMASLAQKGKIDCIEAVTEGIIKINQRDWAPDEDGILRRPR